MAPQPSQPIAPLRVRERVARAGWRMSTPLRRAGGFAFTYHRVSTRDDPFPHVDASAFRRHLEWIGRHFQVVEPATFRAASSRIATGRPPALLTFDDGYRSFHDVVAPLLRQFGLPAVVFIITSRADDPRPLPWDRLFVAVERSRADAIVPPWSRRRQSLASASQKSAFRQLCRAHFRKLPPDEQASTLDAIVERLDPVSSDVPRQTMTWNEIRATADIATAGAHTHTHPYLSALAAPNQLDDEIRVCLERLIAETGQTPSLFAYPHGDASRDAQACLSRHGFDAAFSTEPGVNDADTNWLAARRIGVGDVLPTRWMTTHSWTLAPL